MLSWRDTVFGTRQWQGTEKYAWQKFPAVLYPKYSLGDEIKQRKVSTIGSSMLGRGTRVYDIGINILILYNNKFLYIYIYKYIFIYINLYNNKYSKLTSYLNITRFIGIAYSQNDINLFKINAYFSWFWNLFYDSDITGSLLLRYFLLLNPNKRSCLSPKQLCPQDIWCL
jgi:hypothetical protein